MGGRLRVRPGTAGARRLSVETLVERVREARGAWPAQHLQPAVLFQGGLRGKARDFNWHNVFAFWSAIPLAFVVASGIVISYPWANELVQRLAGSEPGPARRRRKARQRSSRLDQFLEREGLRMR